MSRGHNNPVVDRVPPAGPCPDWNTVEWWVYRTPAPLAGEGGYFYRVVGRELSPGELRMKEELACTVSRASLRQVRDLLERGAEPGDLQSVVDAIADVKARQREAEDVPFRARMEERRAAAQAAFEVRRRAAEQRLAEDVARLPVAA